MSGLTNAQSKVLAQMKIHGPLTKEFTGDEEAPIRYFLSNKGGCVRIATFNILLDLNLIVPDETTALFDGIAQSYVVAK